MFDPTGQFIQHFSLPNDDAKTKLSILDVATDNKDNIYVLVSVSVQCDNVRVSVSVSKEFVVFLILFYFLFIYFFSPFSTYIK